MIRFLSTLSVAIVFLSILIYYNIPSKLSDSSVFCTKNLRGNNMCCFKNIAYIKATNSFAFLLGNKTIIMGLANATAMQHIKLSSVVEHNAFHFNIAPYTNGFNCDKTYKTSVLMARFKNDNVMHVLHDDILPLFNLMLRICGGYSKDCYDSINLFFNDGNIEGAHWFLYKVVNNNPLFLQEKPYNTICFEELHVGLDTDVIWYQYGFGQPRGPLSLDNYNIDNLNKFKQFLLSKLNIVPSSKHHAVILSRKYSRKLLNVEFIRKSVRKFYNGDVIILEISPSTLTDAIQILANADLVIGVHGAELILALFSLPSAKIIEIFPFGITAEAVSYWQTIARVLGFQYFSWVNQLKNNSLAPLVNPDLVGKVSPVKQVFCCDDPMFMYLIYHDTIVSPDFEILVRDAVFSPAVQNTVTWFFPGKVGELSCNITESGVSFSWNKPPNVEDRDINYKIVINIDGVVKSYLSQQNVLFLKGDVVKAACWVSAIAKNSSYSGTDSYCHCVQT